VNVQTAAAAEIFHMKGMIQCECFWFSIVFLFAQNTGAALIAVVGVDRMLALRMAIKLA
jgi:hypothetical protein